MSKSKTHRYCKNCEHAHYNPTEGWCYMFREGQHVAITGTCARFKDASDTRKKRDS
jgi:hypothetical protein